MGRSIVVKRQKMRFWRELSKRDKVKEMNRRTPVRLRPHLGGGAREAHRGRQIYMEVHPHLPPKDALQ